MDARCRSGDKLGHHIYILEDEGVGVEGGLTCWKRLKMQGMTEAAEMGRGQGGGGGGGSE